jgi:hypothetical protein
VAAVAGDGAVGRNIIHAGAKVVSLDLVRD